MAKAIDSGVNKMAKIISGKASGQKQIDQMSRQWKELRHKLDAILLSNNVLKSNELRQKCYELDQMNAEQRRTHIHDNWGPICLEKTMPLLQQLEALERVIAKTKTV